MSNKTFVSENSCCSGKGTLTSAYFIVKGRIHIFLKRQARVFVNSMNKEVMLKENVGKTHLVPIFQVSTLKLEA